MKKIQAVILCAGKSTRTYPLTLTRPKPLLQMAGASLLEYTLFQLQGLVDEVVLVCGYMRQSLEAQIAHIYDRWARDAGFVFTFVEQTEQLGTAHAILQAEPVIRGDFFVLNGDDLYGRADLMAMVDGGPRVLVQEIPDVSRFSSIQVDQQGRVLSVVEKPPQGGPGLAGLGMYLFDQAIFDCIRETPLSSRGEYEITETLNRYLGIVNLGVHAVQDYWLPIGYPWSLVSATEQLFQGPFREELWSNLEKHLGFRREGDLLLGPDTEIDGANLQGPLVIGCGTRITRGASVSGPGFIGRNVHIASGAIIEKSAVFDDVWIDQGVELSHSVIGRGCRIGRGVKALAVPVGSIATSVINGRSESTGMKALGCMIADSTRLGEGVVLASGVKIWPDTSIPAGTTVEEDYSF